MVDAGHFDGSGGSDVGPPQSVTVRFPAHLSFLTVVRSAVGAMVDELECDANCDADLQLAADELAAVVIADARPWSPMEMVLAHDEVDLFVRMSAVRHDPDHWLSLAKVSEMLFAAAVESFDVRTDARCTFGILQRPLVANDRGWRDHGSPDSNRRDGSAAASHPDVWRLTPRPESL